MGTNQSADAKNPGQTSPLEQPVRATNKGKRLTYQESFDIRNKQLVSSNKYNKEERNSFSSNSESDLQSGRSHSSRKKVKRNKSNIRPPLLLYTNQMKMMEYKQKREIFSRKKSISATSENSQKGETLNNAENSSFDNTDIEEVIDLILNDPKKNEKPWYRDPRQSISSSTVSPVQSEKKYSSTEELCSAKSLPTPSFYLYLTFDEDMKKSKSIEVLDAPSYFFLNYEDDSQIPSELDHTLNSSENECVNEPPK